MNYRHAFHAGNFADVVKHAIVALILEHLKKKPTPFRVIDTHAGLGLYDLAADESVRTGEWHDGIGRLLDEPLPANIAAALAPYLDAVARENPGHPGPRLTSAELRRYPGSPLIARHLMRPLDQLVVNELHPVDAEQLAELFTRDRQTKVLSLDGWAALKSLLPPKERRGLVLIDPPFEVPGELARMVQGLREGLRRFATGTFVLWYPIKKLPEVVAFRQEIVSLEIEKLFSVELMVRAADGVGLAGCGLMIANPPYTLHDTLSDLLPFLSQCFAQGPGASGSVTTVPSADSLTARAREVQ